ncbi:MAG: NfeD family protein [Actinomycetota bacterium]
MTTIAVILAWVLLDGVLRIAVIAALALFELFEITLWMRWRKKRSITGAEAIVGTRGVAVTDLRPTGQVRVRGQLWKAHAENEVAAEDAIEVVGVEGIQLRVKRV